jgi:tetratricopeptide (TPR) repeat protein
MVGAMMNRLDVLKGMVAQDPRNALARYGLAMEYVNSEQLEQAVAEFASLIESKPDYAAAYYHSGRTLEKLGRAEEAAAMYRRGIEVTTKSGDAHTRSELQAALDMLG